ncbi:hypothetical protein AFE02nite_11070 [Actinotalea fermentans]|uniref:histidine kinase n=1 Tax=Actinotalea fermentans TaxID=43671 RepID=A0A511YW03_9CELL|nr:hypothetical protein AFE02nite_11070 [Actinotalea fermentans]
MSNELAPGGAFPPPGAAAYCGAVSITVGLPRTALVLGGVAWFLGLLGLVLHLASGAGIADANVLFLLVDVTVAIVYGTVGAVVLARRRHAVGFLVALAGLGGGLSATGGGWGAYAAAHPDLPALDGVAELYGWAWMPGTVALFTVVPWLVRDHPLPTAARVGVLLGAGTAVWLPAAGLLAPASRADAPLVAVVAVGLVSAAATAYRWRRGPVAERRGLGLLTAGAGVLALSFVPLLLVESTPDLVLAVPISHLATQALYPAAILVCVLRNRLWGIDLVVSRATLAGLTTLGMAAVYAALAAAATLLVGGGLVPQLVAAVGMALALGPTRAHLEGRVRTLVYGEAADPGRAALRVGRELAGAGSADDLLAGLARSVGESLRLESVVLRTAPPLAVDASWGLATAAAETLPVLHAGRRVGELTWTARPGERLDARSRQALDHLLPVLAAGIALAHAAHEQRRAHDAATLARLAERRLIRREIHDGLGPWLSGLRLGLQGALNLWSADPAAARALVAALADEAQLRVDDVRSLSRSLLPPALDELGLAAALSELVQRHATEGFTVSVEAHGCDGLVGPEAAAAYGIAAEAVLNAARHSGAAGCTLTVRRSTEGLEVVCEDAGRGVAPDAPPGVGTRTMHERAAERGGTLEITALRPGTRVRAVLPATTAVGAVA